MKSNPVLEEVDPRNEQIGIGFIDVMGFKMKLKKGDNKTKPLQNLWIRYATDQDKKSPNTLAKDSRFYQFIQT